MVKVEFLGCNLDIFENLAASLEKVRQTTVLKWFQSLEIFDFDIFLFACLTRVSL